MSGLGSSLFCTPPESMREVLVRSTEGAPTATRLAATLGPSSRDVSTISALLRSGAKIARFDLTYGDKAYHLETYRNLVTAMKETQLLCAVMLNPAGPDIHVIQPAGSPLEPIALEAGQILRLTNEPGCLPSSSCLPISWPGSFEGQGIAPGASIFVGQYLFTGAETSSAFLTVTEVSPSAVSCIVKNSCRLEGVQLTVKMAEGTVNPLPSLGPKDEAVLKAWVTEASEISSAAGLPGSGVDFLALPRCHTAADVADCRAMLERCGLRGCRVVAKLEDVEGLANHEAICGAADALILSRGSLGTCLEPEKMFLAQKMLLHSANNMGKPVFITRLVDTMTDSPRPTRAEATDVANLVLDGADGILLGSETFRGTYPVDVVHTVSAICRAAEAVFDNYAFYRALVDQGDAADRAEAMASSAVRAAHKMAAKLIVVFTVTGRTARLVAKYKPSQPILTVVCTDPANALFKVTPGHERSPSANMHKVGSDVLLGPSRPDLGSHGPQARACLLYRGALPVMMDAPGGQQGGDVLQTVLDYAKGQGLVVSGDRVVVSQCPRHMDSKVMSEAGVVQLVTVDLPLL